MIRGALCLAVSGLLAAAGCIGETVSLGTGAMQQLSSDAGGRDASAGGEGGHRDEDGGTGGADGGRGEDAGSQADDACAVECGLDGDGEVVFNDAAGGSDVEAKDAAASADGGTDE